METDKKPMTLQECKDKIVYSNWGNWKNFINQVGPELVISKTDESAELYASSKTEALRDAMNKAVGDFKSDLIEEIEKRAKKHEGMFNDWSCGY